MLTLTSVHVCTERRPGGGKSLLRLPIKHCFEFCLSLEVAFSSVRGVRSGWACRAIKKGAEQAPGTATPTPCNWFSVQAGVLQEGSEVSLITVSVLGSRRSEARQASPSSLTQGCVHKAAGLCWGARGGRAAPCSTAEAGAVSCALLLRITCISPGCFAVQGKRASWAFSKQLCAASTPGLPSSCQLHVFSSELEVLQTQFSERCGVLASHLQC